MTPTYRHPLSVESDARLTVSMLSTSRDEFNFPSCSMVMQALAALKNDIQKLKEEESLGAAGGGDDVTTEVTQGDADRPLV